MILREWSGANPDSELPEADDPDDFDTWPKSTRSTRYAITRPRKAGGGLAGPVLARPQSNGQPNAIEAPGWPESPSARHKDFVAGVRFQAQRFRATGRSACDPGGRGPRRSGDGRVETLRDFYEIEGSLVPHDGWPLIIEVRGHAGEKPSQEAFLGDQTTSKGRRIARYRPKGRVAAPGQQL